MAKGRIVLVEGIAINLLRGTGYKHKPASVSTALVQASWRHALLTSASISAIFSITVGMADTRGSYSRRLKEKEDRIQRPTEHACATLIGALHNKRVGGKTSAVYGS